MHDLSKTGVNPDSLLTAIQVKNLIGRSMSTLYRWVSDGRFPKPLKIGPSAIGWRASDYLKWLDNPTEWYKENRRSAHDEER